MIESVTALKTLAESVPGASLRRRERQIVELRAGLNGSDQHSLREIARKLRVSKDRVRQIQNRAIEKLEQEMRG